MTTLVELLAQIDRSEEERRTRLEKERRARFQVQAKREVAQMGDVICSWAAHLPDAVRQLFTITIEPELSSLEGWTEGEPTVERVRVELQLVEMPEVVLRAELDPGSLRRACLVASGQQVLTEFRASVKGDLGGPLAVVRLDSSLPEAEQLRQLALALRPAIRKAMELRQQAAEREQERQAVQGWWVAHRDALRAAFAAQVEDIRARLEAERRRDQERYGWPEGAVLRLYKLSWVAGVGEDGELFWEQWWVTTPEPDAEGWFVALTAQKEKRIRVVSPNGYCLEERVFTCAEDLPPHLRWEKDYWETVKGLFEDQEFPYSAWTIRHYCDLSPEDEQLLSGTTVRLPRQAFPEEPVRRLLAKEGA